MANLFIYDAFTNEKFGGNPAGIILDAEDMKEKEKQQLAKELGFSETVFVQKSKKADWKFEYFTPRQEVDLCGHATIAATYALFDEDKLQGQEVIFIETRLGILSVYLKREAENLLSVWMEQDEGKISYENLAEEKEILDSLGLGKDEIRRDISLVKAYSGLWDLMIPLSSKKALDGIKIDFAQVEKLSEKMGVISFHPFYLQGSEAYVRNFAPIVDIPEEAATGTSNGALSFYLSKIGFLKMEEELICHQGEGMARKSQILVKISKEGKILVGGQAVRIVKGEYK